MANASAKAEAGSAAHRGRRSRAEKWSGTTTEGREGLRTVLEFLHLGDVLLVTRIDRLARSIGELQDIVRTVRARGGRPESHRAAD
jgi:DNA invertase Pin-like site-specific DNA recombinase